MEKEQEHVRKIGSAMNIAVSQFPNKKDELKTRPWVEPDSILTINPLLSWRLHELQVKQKWKSIVGELLAKSASSIVLNRKTLVVSIQSSTIRNELILRKSDVIQRLNEEMQKEVVTDIVYR